MKILLDPQIFNIQKYGGISRYYKEIFSRISVNEEVEEVFLPIFKTENEYLKQSKLLAKHTFISKTYSVLSQIGISTRSIYKKYTNEILNKSLNSSDFDIFIPTYFDTSFLNEIGNKPFVLTVYDMIHELFPNYFINDYFNVISNKLILLEKATMIIAVSNNTKNDILKIYPHIDEKKIKVIYHGSSIQIDNSIKVNLPSKYILFVGSRDKYKNFNFFVESTAELLKEDRTLKIVAAGGGKFSLEEINFFKKLDIEKQVIQKEFKDEQLGHFYQSAISFVFPSMYEGFGIPVLESMVCGCPVILANHSSFPEVAGEAGIYFELDSKDDLRNKIKLIIENPTIREEYIKKGFNQSNKFDWETAAKECLEVYKMAIIKKKIKNKADE